MPMLASTVHMDMSTEDSPNPHWRMVLKEQGRSIGWLADRTGRKRRTVYSYSTGQVPHPPAEWLAKASEVLGVDVTG